jgi:hypothetical protein
VKKKLPAKKKLKIEQATVDAFSKKLKEWSKALPEEERDLVRLLVDRATAVNVGDLGSYNLKAKVGPEAEKLFKSLRGAAQSLPAGSGVNLDPGDVWLKIIETGLWLKGSSIVVNPAATRARGGGNQ